MKFFTVIYYIFAVHSIVRFSNLARCIFVYYSEYDHVKVILEKYL
jgi:hypothetical protein